MSKLVLSDIKKIVEYNMRTVQGLDGGNVELTWKESFTDSEGGNHQIEYPLTKLRDMISQSILDVITDCTPSGNLSSGNNKGSVSLNRDNSKIILKIGSISFEVARNGDPVKVTIPPGTFIESVSGGSGAPALGIPNVAPVDITGTIQAGSTKVEVE